jgi:hypothetical protein
MDTVFQPGLQKDVRSLGAVAAFLLLVVGLPMAMFRGEQFAFSSPVGMVVAEIGVEQVSSIVVPQIVSYGLILAAAAFFIYRRHFLDPLPDATLLEMHAGSAKNGPSSGFVADKIKNWKRKK